MIDTQLIKDNPKSVTEKLTLRNYNFNIEFSIVDAVSECYKMATEKCRQNIKLCN